MTEKVADLRSILLDDSSLRLQRIVDLLTEERSPEESREFFTSLLDGNDQLLFQNLFAYFKLFRDHRGFCSLLNRPTFPVELLEGYVVDILNQARETDGSIEDMLDRQLGFLEAECFVRLLSSSERLHEDTDFFLYALIKLDSQSISEMIQSDQKIRQVLAKVLFDSSEERFHRLLARNPEIFDSIIDFMRKENREDLAKDFTDRYSALFQESIMTRSLIDQITFELADCEAESRGRRVEVILEELQEAPDIRRALELLDYNNIFIDDHERDLVTRVLFDHNVRSLFNAGEKQIEQPIVDIERPKKNESVSSQSEVRFGHLSDS